MECDLDLINSKIKKYKLLRFLSIFLASLLTLVGTISIVSLLMFLNIYLGVGYFSCFVLAFVLSQFYSLVINDVVLKKIDNKIDDVLSDIVKMINGLNYQRELEFDVNNKDIELRFERCLLEKS